MRTKLKIFRISRKLTQQQAASLLGYERAYYGHVERGFQQGSAAFWERLQTAFELTEKQVEELKELD